MIDPALRADLEARRSGEQLPQPALPLPPLDPAVDYSRSAYLARDRARRLAAGLRPAPEPRGYDLPFYTAPDGYCRLCGEPTIRPRYRWHEGCLAEYEPVASQASLRRAVWERDRGQCAECPDDASLLPRFSEYRFPCGADTLAIGATCPETWRARIRGEEHACGPPIVVGWECDHVVPVEDGGEHCLANVQTLCIPHHRRKSALEAAARAARRRELAARLAVAQGRTAQLGRTCSQGEGDAPMPTNGQAVRP